jgi:hypothetical protein
MHSYFQAFPTNRRGEIVAATVVPTQPRFFAVPPFPEPRRAICSDSNLRPCVHSFRTDAFVARVFDGKQAEATTTKAAIGYLGKLGGLEGFAMTSRERWIVYPLLLLTLGIVMRDKVVPQGHFQANEVTAARIRCGQLQVDQAVSADGIAARSLQCRGELAAGRIHSGQLQVDQGASAGEFAVLSGQRNGLPTVLIGTDPKTKGGLIRTLSPAGVPLILLVPTDSGGVVVASRYEKITGMAPHEKRQSPAPPAAKESSKEPQKSPAKASQ